MNPHALAGALAELGEYTAYGWGGVVRNLPKAQQLWERSAAAGDARGLYLLGELLLCRSGDLACVFFSRPPARTSILAENQRACRQSAELFRASANQGNVLAKYRLGLLLLPAGGSCVIYFAYTTPHHEHCQSLVHLRFIPQG